MTTALGVGSCDPKRPDPTTPRPPPDPSVQVDHSTVHGNVAGRDIVTTTIVIEPPPPLPSVIDAGVLDAPRLPTGSIGHFENAVSISDGGVLASGTLDVTSLGDGRVRLDLHGDCTNKLAVVAVYVTVIATIVLADGNVYSEVRVDIPEAPAAGLSPGTHRGNNASITVSGAPAGPLPVIREVRFRMFDRHSP
jgi:hypothetical protein